MWHARGGEQEEGIRVVQSIGVACSWLWQHVPADIGVALWRTAEAIVTWVKFWRAGRPLFAVDANAAGERSSVAACGHGTFIIDASCISVGPSCSIEFHFVYALSGGLLAFTRQQAPMNPGTKARSPGMTYIVCQAPGFFPHKGVRNGNKEFVFVVAVKDGEAVYYEDVEEGFNRSPLSASGEILQHWSNQDDLQDALYSWVPPNGAK